jgi:hypothetical protein
MLFAIAVVCALLGLPASLCAEDVRVYPIASNFSGKGLVVELDFPEKDDGIPFYVVYLTGSGQGNIPMQARAGRHSYEMRDRDQWEGPVRLIGITVPNVPGRLKKPALSDEIDMYFQPDQVIPSTVNVARDRRLFTWPENIFVMFVALLSAFGFSRLKKTTVTQSALLGFLAAWGMMSVHRIYDHIAIVSTMEAHKPGMFALASLTEFVDHASLLIGNETWEDDLDGVYRSYLHYRLAERQYIPINSAHTAAFRITRSPGGGQILRHETEYYLVKNKQH